MNDVLLDNIQEKITEIDFDKLKSYEYETLVKINKNIEQSGNFNISDDKITELNDLLSFEKKRIKKYEYLNNIGYQLNEKEDLVTGDKYLEIKNSLKYRISFIASIIVSIFLIPFAIFALLLFLSIVFGLMPEKVDIMTFLLLGIVAVIGIFGIRLFLKGIFRFKMNEYFRILIRKSEIEISDINNKKELYPKNEYIFLMKKENGNNNLYLKSEYNSVLLFNSKFDNRKYQETLEFLVQKLNNY